LREHQGAIRDAGATLAAVGLGDFHFAQVFRDETGIDFPLLIDEKRQAYQAADLKSANLLHVLRRDNARARARARAAGQRQRGLGANPFQLGGSFVFGPGNRDIYAHVSRTFGDNATAEELLQAVRSAK
jgi:hypothetical protein